MNLEMMQLRRVGLLSLALSRYQAPASCPAPAVVAVASAGGVSP